MYRVRAAADTIPDMDATEQEVTQRTQQDAAAHAARDAAGEHERRNNRVFKKGATPTKSPTRNGRTNLSQDQLEVLLTKGRREEERGGEGEREGGREGEGEGERQG